MAQIKQNFETRTFILRISTTIDIPWKYLKVINSSISLSDASSSAKSPTCYTYFYMNSHNGESCMFSYGRVCLYVSMRLPVALMASQILEREVSFESSLLPVHHKLHFAKQSFFSGFHCQLENLIISFATSNCPSICLTVLLFRL